jgi:hypothetical protein
VARAKRTDRTEARRRHRAEQAMPAMADSESDAPAAGKPAAGKPPAGKPAARSAPPAPVARPSITAAVRQAVRPLDLRGDLRAFPSVVLNWGFLASIALTIVAGAWFVAAYSAGMSAIPVGSATTEQLQAVVGENTIPLFLGQMAFLTPPPAIGAFLIGFTAKRASWLGGLVYGLFVVAVVAVILQTPAGRLLTGDQPGGIESLLVGHAAFSPIGAALFASLLAWYRRFLELASPNRAQRAQPRRPHGRGDMKPARR